MSAGAKKSPAAIAENCSDGCINHAAKISAMSMTNRVSACRPVKVSPWILAPSCIWALLSLLGLAGC